MMTEALTPRQQMKHRLGEYLAIKAEAAQIEAQRQALTGEPGGQNLDGMPRGSAVGNPVAAVAEQRQALLEKYQAKLAALYEAQSRIEAMIEGLDSVERQLLRHRYLEGMRWEDVCVAMSYSWRQTHNIHAHALDKLVEEENHGKDV